MSTEALATQEPLPIGGSGHHSSSWWGVWSLILTEASLFGYLLLTYFYLYSQTQNHWPPEGMPKLLIPGINTVILLLSSVFIWLGERHIKRGKRKAGMIWTVVAIIAGALFVGIQFKEWHDKPYTMTTNLYGSLYFTITGFHMLHVIIGLIILSFLLLWTGLGYFDEKRHSALTIGGLYWHFVDAVWLFVFSSLYLFPYMVR